MEPYLIIPVQEIARGKPKFGVWVIGEEKMVYVRMKEGTWGDALKRGMAYGAGNLSMLASMEAWENYSQMIKEYLSSLELPADFIDNIEKYVAERNGFMAPVNEVSVKRGKGVLASELNGQTPVELKSGRKKVKFYVDTEFFERVVKPFLKVTDLKDYKEVRVWAF